VRLIFYFKNEYNIHTNAPLKLENSAASDTVSEREKMELNNVIRKTAA